MLEFETVETLFFKHKFSALSRVYNIVSNGVSLNVYDSRGFTNLVARQAFVVFFLVTDYLVTWKLMM